MGLVQYELASSKRGGKKEVDAPDGNRSGTVMNWELVDMAAAVLL